ncbi:MAG: hypothetical protein JRD47_06930 [Deltaproteobacteria bacterium]|nr:hypothetical protein [Deltaproteobacteria bacterium]MBW2601644.1 hypothetical protein [Deltaproteobacteria bacterium]
MAYEVDEEILKLATKCGRNFKCLSDESPDICGVLRAVGTQLIITNCTEHCAMCPYCLSFNPVESPAATESFCTCPVRIELYKRYGI